MVSAASHASTLVSCFIAEVLERTLNIVDDVAHQHAVQAFVDELKPWTPPARAHVRQHPPLFYSRKLDEIAIEVAVDFTPRRRLVFLRLAPPSGTSPILAEHDHNRLWNPRYICATLSSGARL